MFYIEQIKQYFNLKFLWSLLLLKQILKADLDFVLHKLYYCCLLLMCFFNLSLETVDNKVVLKLVGFFHVWFLKLPAGGSRYSKTNASRFLMFPLKTPLLWLPVQTNTLLESHFISLLSFFFLYVWNIYVQIWSINAEYELIWVCCFMKRLWWETNMSRLNLFSS